MIRRSSAVAGLTAVLALAAAGVASAHTIVRPQPRTSPFQSAFNDVVGSTNWSGYAVQAPSRFTSVSGSWVEPTATCSGTTTRRHGRGGRGGGGSQTFASFWAGIDGYSSNSVEQLGTDSDCNGGTPSYYAWYELFPAGSINLSTSQFPVRPGDTLSASVTFSGTSFTLSMSSSEGWRFSTSGSASVAQSSAELIAESPEVCSGNFCQLANLSNFGTVNFSGATATAGGAASPFGSFTADSGPHEIVGVTNSGAVKMQPSSLSGGNAFSVSWEHS